MTTPSVVIRAELENVDPSIWRVVRVPADLRLSDLHRVLQMVMEWHDRHPHAFDITGACGRVTQRVDDEGQTVAATLAIVRAGLLYTYMAEDAWQVRIMRTPGAWKGAKHAISCLDGYLAAPRDDDGGPVAYNAVLAATLGPDVTRAQLERFGPRFDPERFDRGAINRALSTLAPTKAIARDLPVPAP